MEPAGADDQVLVMHEDDWRQLELVSVVLRSDVAAEFSRIDAVKRAGGGAGYTEVHLRTQPQQPLVGSRLTAADIELALDDLAAHSVRISFEFLPGQVARHGFAYVTTGGAIYGLQPDQQVSVLGLMFSADQDEANQLVDIARRLATAAGLMLVDWVATKSSPSIGPWA